MGRPVDAVETFVLVGGLALALLLPSNRCDLSDQEKRDGGCAR